MYGRDDAPMRSFLSLVIFLPETGVGSSGSGGTVELPGIRFLVWQSETQLEAPAPNSPAFSPKTPPIRPPLCTSHLETLLVWRDLLATCGLSLTRSIYTRRMQPMSSYD